MCNNDINKSLSLASEISSTFIIGINISICPLGIPERHGFSLNGKNYIFDLNGTTVPRWPMYFALIINTDGVVVEPGSRAIKGYTVKLFGDPVNVIYVVFDGTLESIALTTPPDKTIYNKGETLDLTGMIVTATYRNSNKKPVIGYATTPQNGEQQSFLPCLQYPHHYYFAR
ncbi:MAG: bacterial Ig-like domain-containing protein [Clostridiales bacterium]|nr:bacterial Ig-like domain-containing protein [Clostridiales bacterium]